MRYFGVEVEPINRRWPQAGDKMRFLNEGGYDSEREDAAKKFDVDGVYEVERCDVGNFHHVIRFKGIIGGWNGVMFERVT